MIAIYQRLFQKSADVFWLKMKRRWSRGLCDYWKRKSCTVFFENVKISSNRIVHFYDKSKEAEFLPRPSGDIQEAPATENK